MTKTETWNLPAPPGFQGLRDDIPISKYDRHLPHWRQDGATYFVTFRLADSLPQEKLDELRSIEVEWKRKHPPPRSDADWEELLRITSGLAEGWLDQGFGSCCLRDSTVAQIVVDSLHHFDPTSSLSVSVGRTSGPSVHQIDGVRTDGPDVRPTVGVASQTERRYELDCYVIMPNHVHAIIKPLLSVNYPLEKILQASKTFTSRSINKTLKQQGTLWQDESFDRIIRDEEHLWRTIQYIGQNPGKAGLSAKEYRRWIRPEWEELGWRFVDD